MAMDLSLIKGDMEMAGAIWRNMLGARGARGIAFPGEPKQFRRSVNLVGSTIHDVDKMDLPEEEAKDDGSGVHDFYPEEADNYLAYPELMLDLVAYVRRELSRLDKLTDEQMMFGDWEAIMFQPITRSRDVKQQTKTASKVAKPVKGPTVSKLVEKKTQVDSTPATPVLQTTKARKVSNPKPIKPAK